MPTFVIPLFTNAEDIRNAEVVAVFSVVIKPKNQSQMDEAKVFDEELINSIGHEDPFQIMIEIFTKILAHAFMFVQKKISLK